MPPTNKSTFRLCRNRVRRSSAAGQKQSIQLTITIVQQVMTSNASLDVVWRLYHIIHSLLCANVFHGDFEVGKVCNEGFHYFFNKDGFAFEDVGVGDFGMDTKHHALFRHFFEGRITLFDVCHTKVRVGGCSCRIVLAPHNAFFSSFSDFLSACNIRKVEDHERLKVRKGAWWHRCLDVFLVLRSYRGSCDGRFEVGHHEASTESLCCMLQDSCGLGAVPTMMMKVVRQADYPSCAFRGW